jgi:hypothetical protein
MELPAHVIEFWRAYFNIVPFTQIREDLRAASIAATILNTMRTKATDKVWTAMDLMPDYFNELNRIEPQTEEKLIEAEKAFAAKALSTGLGKMENTDDHST